MHVPRHPQEDLAVLPKDLPELRVGLRDEIILVGVIVEVQQRAPDGA